MNDSEKMLDVAEPTMEEVEITTSETEEMSETNNIDLEFTDTTVPEEKVEKVMDQPKQEQSKEENSKYAQARRKAEAEFKKKEEEAYRRGKFEAFKGKINPYTNIL